MTEPYPRRLVQRFGAGPTSALTAAELIAKWADLGRSPILVARSHCEAHWALTADLVEGEGGLVVARLWAPWAKQVEPAPGTSWPWSPRPTGDAGGIT